MTRPWPVLFLALLVLAGCGGDREQARICARVVAAVESWADLITERPLGAVVVTDAVQDPRSTRVVTVSYRFENDPDQLWRGQCRFAGDRLDRDRHVLEAIETASQGSLSPVRVHMARVWLGQFTAQSGQTALAPVSTPISGPTWVLYLAQQLVNALAIGCVYGLLAVGYTLIWGLARRINLAFGELAMIGAMTAYLSFSMYTIGGGQTLLFAVGAALWLAAAVTVAHATVLDRLVFTPTQAMPGQATLIGTLGAALVLQEYVRLVQGADDHWLQPIYAWPLLLAGNADLRVTVSLAQLGVAATAVVAGGGLLLMLKRTRFGLTYRAAADDPGMAEMLGADSRAVRLHSFICAGGMAALAGGISAIHFGGVNFFMGVMLGFKALTAALIGGIGSVAGALLGGIVLGIIETLWTGYLDGAWRNVAVFSALTAILIFRPQGLLGRSEARNL